MRTTLDLPEALLEEARDSLGYKSKTDTIVYALKEVVRRSQLDELKAMFGKVRFIGDPVAMRGKPRPEKARPKR